MVIVISALIKVNLVFIKVVSVLVIVIFALIKVNFVFIKVNTVFVIVFFGFIKGNLELIIVIYELQKVKRTKKNKIGR